MMVSLIRRRGRPPLVARTTTFIMIAFAVTVIAFMMSNPVNAATPKKKKKRTTMKNIDTTQYTNICGASKPSLNKRGHGIVKTLLKVSGSAALKLKSSPQHKAMCWIINDDPKKMGAGSKKRLRQRYATGVLYYAMGGSEWKRNAKWLTKAHECSWTGITCDWANSSIVAIDLAFNNLAGVIPREIGELSYLTSLELYANELSGIIPARIGDLQKLKVLKLQINALIGSLPLELGNCKSLVQLVVYANYLNGKLPDTIGKLEKLEVLDVYANNLTGLPPKSMAKMKNLEEVYINHNDMAGRIPKLDVAKAKGKDKSEYQNICSVKQLKVFQSDCLPATGFPAEIHCECCTICCNDHTDPQCVPVKTKVASKK